MILGYSVYNFRLYFIYFTLMIFILAVIEGVHFSRALGRSPTEWKSRTIYQGNISSLLILFYFSFENFDVVLTDRFASTQTNTDSKCNDLSVYCGGNYQGLISKLGNKFPRFMFFHE